MYMKKPRVLRGICYYFSIKSPLLYRLSYAFKCFPFRKLRPFPLDPHLTP
jgi:hypothetical protein